MRLVVNLTVFLLSMSTAYLGHANSPESGVDFYIPTGHKAKRQAAMIPVTCPAPVDDARDADYPSDCWDILQSCLGQFPRSGQYDIKPYGHEVIRVYCDMETDGGGWTVFQRRVDGAIDFYRPWDSYKEGFGNLNTEFWLGNNNIHYISTQKEYQMRLDMKNSLGDDYFAMYDDFHIGDEYAKYILFIGQYSGTAGDSLSNYNRQKFSTYNQDYSSASRASQYRGAWWFTSSLYSHLNGNYHGYSGASSIYWSLLPGNADNIQFSEMKMRPKKQKL